VIALLGGERGDSDPISSLLILHVYDICHINMPRSQEVCGLFTDEGSSNLFNLSGRLLPIPPNGAAPSSIFMVDSIHRHLSKIDCITARTGCLVCFISTVNGCSKKRRKEGY